MSDLFACKEIAKAIITSVPGSVGPMIVDMLIPNSVQEYHLGFDQVSVSKFSRRLKQTCLNLWIIGIA